MYYTSVLSSSFAEERYKEIVEIRLKELKEDVDVLVHWNKQYVDEYNCMSFSRKEKYNDDYLELQRLINKITKE